MNDHIDRPTQPTLVPDPLIAHVELQRGGPEPEHFSLTGATELALGEQVAEWVPGAVIPHRLVAALDALRAYNGWATQQFNPPPGPAGKILIVVARNTPVDQPTDVAHQLIGHVEIPGHAPFALTGVGEPELGREVARRINEVLGFVPGTVTAGDVVGGLRGRRAETGWFTQLFGLDPLLGHACRVRIVVARNKPAWPGGDLYGIAVSR